MRARAERLAAAVGGEVEETVGRVGGGALPLAELPCFACAVEETLAEPLRLGEPPVVGVVRDGRLLLDCRTLTRCRGGRGRGAVRRMPLTVGTAGHIDHGKTWLVRALTGKDTDRLPEERAAGSRSTSATRRSSCPTDAGSRSSTCPATSASCATWSPAPRGSISSCS